MKKISVLLSFCLIAFGMQAQKLRVTAPSSLVKNLNFDYAENGATPSWGNVAITSTYSNISVELANDGSSSPEKGCGTLSNTTMTGKAALVYRGTCEFGVKAKNAQDAGAVICIIVNNDPLGAVGMAGGTQGPNVNIPVLMIGKSDGDLIKAQLDAGTNVTISLTPWSYGYNYDIAIEQGYAVRPYNLTQPQYLLSASSSLLDNEYYHVYDGATYIQNYSAEPFDSIFFKTGIYDGSSMLHGDSVLRYYTDTIFPTTNIMPGDSSDTSIAMVFNGSYDLNSLAKGSYDVMTMAEIAVGNGDENFGDNVSASKLTITDNMYSKSSLKADNTPYIDFTFSPVGTAQWGQVLHFPLAQKMIIEKVTMPVFLRANSGTDDLDGKTVTINVYKWVNADGDSALDEAELTDNLVGTGSYTFPAGSIVDPATRTLLTDFYLTDLDLYPGDSGVAVTDVGVYWVAAALDGATDIGFGVDKTADNSLRNNFFKYSSQNASPLSSLWPQALISDNGFYSTYSNTGVPAMVLTMKEKPDGINDVNKALELSVFPNPASNYAQITATFDQNQEFIAYEVMDVTGKMIQSDRVENATEANFDLNTSRFAPGSYVIKVSSPEGFNTRTLIKR